jgi:hypothetical protein|tara:strand:- start:45 stop:395 length:351 start_codon:yes stop_codon:yes gene_type:complete
MKNYNDNLKSIYNERGPASLSDNLKYINNSVSHLEINRFCGTKDTMGYQVVCKAITINVVTGKKAFVVWAVQEGYDDLEVIVQKAKDELQNRIVMGAPVLQHAAPDEDVKNLVEYK